MVTLVLFVIGSLLVLIVMLLSATYTGTNKLGTLLTVIGLLGAIAGLTYLVDDGQLFSVVGFFLLVIAWLTSLILHGPLLIRGGLLGGILCIIYTALNYRGLLVFMLLLAIARLIYILFTDPLRSIYADAEQDVLERSAHYLNNVRRMVRR